MIFNLFNICILLFILLFYFFLLCYVLHCTGSAKLTNFTSLVDDDKPDSDSETLTTTLTCCPQNFTEAGRMA